MKVFNITNLPDLENKKLIRNYNREQRRMMDKDMFK